MKIGDIQLIIITDRLPVWWAAFIGLEWLETGTARAHSRRAGTAQPTNIDAGQINN